MEQLRPPRVPFVDPRTGIISREWYRWLMLVTNAFDDSDASSAFDATVGAAAVAEVEKSLADASLTTNFPFPPISQSREIEDANLTAQFPRPVVDPTRDIQDARLSTQQLVAEVSELKKELDDLKVRFFAVTGLVPIYDHGELVGLTDDDHTQYLLADGTRTLSAAWDAGSWQIRAETFQSDVTTGTAPLTVASTTKVTNLNADLLDDQTGSYYLDSANFTGTNWTDLTDSGETTLHTHAATSVTNFHALVAAHVSLSI